MSTAATASTAAARARGRLGEGRKLPRWFPYAALVGSVVVGLGIARALGGGLVATVALALLVYVAGSTAISVAVEGSRKATDRLATTAVTAAFGIAMIPLVSLLVTVVSRGAARFDGAFFNESMRGVVGEGGGAYHAIMGTVIITLLATVISVPIGLFTSVYLVEYGTGRLAKWITFLVDVMTGIPSIVAGLFAFALFALLTGDPGYRSGLAGAVALSVLMIPVVVRSTQEMLLLVPNELREAAYALGVPKWATIAKVVVPTALAGIVTGVTLAIARVIGETAPPLITAGFASSTNTDPLANRMSTLPVYIYYQFTQPGVPPQTGIDRAWTAALVLILIVMALNLIARIISKIFSPKKA